MNFISDCEDIAQEVCLYIVEHPEELDTRDLKLIVIDVIRSMYGMKTTFKNKAYRTRDLVDADTHMKSLSIEEFDTSKIDIQYILNRISPKDRFVLERILDGHTSRDIAEELSVWDSEFSKYLKRLFLKIRQFAQYDHRPSLN